MLVLVRTYRLSTLETIANNNAAIESRVPRWEHARRRIDRKKAAFGVPSFVPKWRARRLRWVADGDGQPIRGIAVSPP